MGHKEPSYKSSWGKVDWLDEHEYSCLALQGQSLDPEQHIYQWSILDVGSFCGPNFCNNCRWTGLDRGNYIYQWFLMVHFVAHIFLINLFHGILKVAKVDIILLYKTWKVWEIIHGRRSILPNGMTLCENLNKSNPMVNFV